MFGYARLLLTRGWMVTFAYVFTPSLVRREPTNTNSRESTSFGPLTIDTRATSLFHEASYAIVDVVAPPAPPAARILAIV